MIMTLTVGFKDLKILQTSFKYRPFAEFSFWIVGVLLLQEGAVSLPRMFEFVLGNQVQLTPDVEWLADTG